MLIVVHSFYNLSLYDKELIYRIGTPNTLIGNITCEVTINQIPHYYGDFARITTHSTQNNIVLVIVLVISNNTTTLITSTFRVYYSCFIGILSPPAIVYTS